MMGDYYLATIRQYWNSHCVHGTGVTVGARREEAEDEQMKIGPWVATEEEEGALALAGQIRSRGCKLQLECSYLLVVLTLA
jgi:hypothetical protein